MKKIIFILLIVLTAPFVYDQFFPQSQIIQKSLTLTKNQAADISNQSQISFNHKNYSYSFFTPNSSQQLIFNLNLTDKKPSLDIIEEQHCQYLINGGFYNKSDQPIGLVIKDGFEISPFEKNTLFNGFISSSASAEFIISSSQPPLMSQLAIQTGPILIRDSGIQSLKLITDQHKRRMVLAISKDYLSYFFSITLDSSEAEGPLLKDLPEIINQIGKKENIEFVSAINLDGGSASTFYSPKIHLKELTTIGSYLCFK
jgi:exopolysaccharide biosynthesis protein